MRTKEEVIKEHYLKHISEEDFSKLKIREDGQAIMYNEEGAQLSPNFMFLGFTQRYVSENIDNGIDIKTNEMVWRPKSLSGIEDNRGWTRIESKDDLPKEGHLFWVMKKGYDYPLSEAMFNDDGEYWLSCCTHYKPFVKPEPPIY